MRGLERGGKEERKRIEWVVLNERAGERMEGGEKKDRVGCVKCEGWREEGRSREKDRVGCVKCEGWREEGRSREKG